MSDNSKAFKVQNGLVVTGDISADGTITAAAFFGDGSGLTNVSGGVGGGLSQESVEALIVSIVDEAYVQNHSLSTADVTAQINSIVDQAYVVARQTGLTELEVTNAVNAAINSRLEGLEWSFDKTVSAPNYKEGVYEYTGIAVQLQPNHGSLQTHAVSGATIYTASNDWDSGESLTLHITTDGSTITWPTGTKWVGNTAPSISTLNVTHIFNFWKVGTDLYGAYVGEAS